MSPKKTSSKKYLNELSRRKIIAFSAAIRDNSLPIVARNKLKKEVEILKKKI